MLKKFIAGLLMLLSFGAQAYDVSQGYAGSKLLISPTTVLVNQAGSAVSAAVPLEAKLPLQQDLINNPNSLQPTRTFGYVYGRNNAVQNVRCDLWEGPTCTYVFPPSAIQMAVSSSSASDASAGTGCQQVMIHYLDALYAPHTEVVTLNGVTPVNTVASMIRINAFHCIQVGTGGVAAGNISVKNVAATVTYAYISTGFSTARQAIYTVPAGVWGYNHTGSRAAELHPDRTLRRRPCEARRTMG